MVYILRKFHFLKILIEKVKNCAIMVGAKTQVLPV